MRSRVRSLFLWQMVQVAKEPAGSAESPAQEAGKAAVPAGIERGNKV